MSKNTKNYYKPLTCMYKKTLTYSNLKDIMRNRTCPFELFFTVSKGIRFIQIQIIVNMFISRRLLVRFSHSDRSLKTRVPLCLRFNKRTPGVKFCLATRNSFVPLSSKFPVEKFCNWFEDVFLKRKANCIKHSYPLLPLLKISLLETIKIPYSN